MPRPRMSSPIRPALAIIAAGAFTAAANGQIQFLNLGTLPGGETIIAGSGAANLNADGSVVVGASQTPSGRRGFLWTDAGMVDLGVLPPPALPNSTAHAITSDARVITGNATSPNNVACRWVALPEGGYGPTQRLNGAPTTDFSETRAISDDGSFVMITVIGGADSRRTYRWSASSLEQVLPLPPEPPPAPPPSPLITAVVGADMSAAGDIIVGHAQADAEIRAFFWTPTTPVTLLPVLPGSAGSKASSITDDGSVIAGTCGVHPVRWRRNGSQWNIETLMIPPGTASASIGRMSGDGAILCGSDNTNRIWIWGPSGQPVLLNQLLQSSGVSVDGVITAVNAINGTGSALVGTMTNTNGRNRAWLIRNVPHLCGSSDFNNDGDSGTDADIEAFFACLAGNCCTTCAGSDFNGDGDSGTDADIEAFFRVLAGGAC